MPLCDGRPEGPCPDRRCDSSVRHSQGDLMLCPACDAYRFPINVAAVATVENVAAKVQAPAAGVNLLDSEMSSVNVEHKRGMVVNELLCFLSSKIHNYPLTMIKKAILEFYREDEILTAKHIILQSVIAVTDKSLVQQYSRKRIGENKNKSTLDDIVNIWSVADENNLIDKLSIFCAADLSRIPALTDELTDIAMIRNTVINLEAQVRALTDSLSTIQLVNNQMHAELLPSRNDEMDNVNNDTCPVSSDITVPHPEELTPTENDGAAALNYVDAVKHTPPNVDNEGYQLGQLRAEKRIKENLLLVTVIRATNLKVSLVREFSV